ncbi:MAG: 4-(cytidine 5'-diphospho)-2-C-methyl-D-erythritol kinase [Candidatus Binataceae bacterium]|jgi:4-diphosphocytidyl-2-C-methyl-D-erythritol kinase
MVKLLSEDAPAKINLFLRVVGRRADGYHELDSVFLPITLADSLRIELRPSVRRQVALQGNLGGLPADDRNLAVKAAKCFIEEFDLNAEVLIGLDKAIPAGAGLGGGSSDAGAVLRMMAALTRISEPERLARIALAIGADVPFFLDPQPARIGGIGERITSVEPTPDWPLLIVVPPIEVPTAAIFAGVRQADWSGRAADNDAAALIAGDLRPDLFVNDLERAAVERWPEIGRLKNAVIESGAQIASMSGSGGGVFGLFATFAHAESAAATLRRLDPRLRVFLARPWRPEAMQEPPLPFSNVDK